MLLAINIPKYSFAEIPAGIPPFAGADEVVICNGRYREGFCSHGIIEYSWYMYAMTRTKYADAIEVLGAKEYTMSWPPMLYVYVKHILPSSDKPGTHRDIIYNRIVENRDSYLYKASPESKFIGNNIDKEENADINENNITSIDKKETQIKTDKNKLKYKLVY
jgi:hypothetical protein